MGARVHQSPTLQLQRCHAAAVYVHNGAPPHRHPRPLILNPQPKTAQATFTRMFGFTGLIMPSALAFEGDVIVRFETRAEARETYFQRLESWALSMVPFPCLKVFTEDPKYGPLFVWCI